MVRNDAMSGAQLKWLEYREWFDLNFLTCTVWTFIQKSSWCVERMTV